MSEYSLNNLRRDFPDEAACLTWLVEYLYPDGIFCIQCDKETKHYPIKGRKVYSCGNCGWHVSPTAGTIFHKSRTPLTDWFYAIWIIVNDGIHTSATRLHHELGCTYKAAWRIKQQITSRLETDE